MDGKDQNNADVAKFRDYFEYDEPIGRVPSHRALAVFRGRGLEILDAKLVLPAPPEAYPLLAKLHQFHSPKPASPCISAGATSAEQVMT